MHRRAEPFTRPIVSIALCTALALAFPIASRAQSEVATFVSSRDNTLFQDSTGSLSNGAGPCLFAGTEARSFTSLRGLIYFDVSSIPSYAVVDSVTLTLFVTRSPTSVQQPFSLHRVLQSWGEAASNTSGGTGAPAEPGDATWLNTFYPSSFWTNPGGDFVSTASGSRSVGNIGSYTWRDPGMIADVQSWLVTPANNFGWLVLGDETVLRTARRFATREAITASQRPTLTVYYLLPLPARRTTWSALKSLYR